MHPVVYVEDAVRDHPRVLQICARLGSPTVVGCERYTEVFNPRAQNFRLQKKNPGLILARKHGSFLMDAPAAYGVGGEANYYFSHMLNCLYDCRYCFLQGMFRSAHYVVFVNYEDFTDAMEDRLAGSDTGGPAWFFSGYDCDSLAYEPVTRFAEHFIPYFSSRPNGCLELRTKSTQIRSLLGRDPLPNVVTAFSFTPQHVSVAVELKVPTVDSRLRAMARLQQAGWPVAVRLDPLIYYDGYREGYGELVEQIFTRLDPDRIHSAGLGPFRMPRDFYNNIVKLYPESPLFASPVEIDGNGLASYPEEVRQEMLDHVSALLLQWMSRDRIFNHETA